ncbi:aminoglycoside phosphotransferase family protein [Paenibacillus qinlingensis]|uniref:Serine/threonine protein kinase n=1 Tax=Paenibacillus qinlingensis TaxID=1837343 RepID=A0ABU1NRU6_9BACL|nr:aminoglycoside phosphotransferase family protein [Paenibacillus qinlingensis]MDR6550169.1 serine/threonine protein kinase [Paenibacillus qinlingensis]
MKYGEIIGEGQTATVYAWEAGKVLKLYHQGYPESAAQREFQNAMAIQGYNFAHPKAHELIYCDDRIGIVFDRVEGESLLSWVFRTRDLQGCAAYMANLHKKILQNNVSGVENYKAFLKSNLLKSSSEHIPDKANVIRTLDKLKDGDTLCHGDFHPGNILISNGQTMVVDFMNLCHGDYLYDVARTVFLVAYTPVPAVAEQRETLLYFKNKLAELYLIEMNVTREMIQDYLAVIVAARAGECPDEEVKESKAYDS